MLRITEQQIGSGYRHPQTISRTPRQRPVEEKPVLFAARQPSRRKSRLSWSMLVSMLSTSSLVVVLATLLGNKDKPELLLSNLPKSRVVIDGPVPEPDPNNPPARPNEPDLSLYEKLASDIKQLQEDKKDLLKEATQLRKDAKSARRTKANPYIDATDEVGKERKRAHEERARALEAQAEKKEEEASALQTQISAKTKEKARLLREQTDQMLALWPQRRKWKLWNRVPIDSPALVDRYDESVQVWSSTSQDSTGWFNPTGSFHMQELRIRAAQEPSLFEAQRKIMGYLAHNADGFSAQTPLYSVNAKNVWRKADNADLGQHRYVMTLIGNGQGSSEEVQEEQATFLDNGFIVKDMVVKEFGVPNDAAHIPPFLQQPDLKAIEEAFKAMGQFGKERMEKGIEAEGLIVVNGHGSNWGGPELTDPFVTATPITIDQDGALVGSVSMATWVGVSDQFLKKMSNQYLKGNFGKGKVVILVVSCYSSTFLAQNGASKSQSTPVYG